MKQAPSGLKMGKADTVIAHALSLGRELGISDRDMAAAAMRMAVALAEKKGDPDGWLAMVHQLPQKGARR